MTSEPDPAGALPAEDKVIYCHDCGREFLFTVSEQVQFDVAGWCRPKRCKRCRAIRRNQPLPQTPG